MIDISGQMPVPTAQISVKSKSALAIRHLIAAARFSRLVGEIETAHPGSEYGPYFDEECAYASACFLLATASLEAHINEWLDERGLKLAIDKGSDESKILKKYTAALAGKSPGPMSENDWQYADAQTLILLRNKLVHFKPEWADERRLYSALEERLRLRCEMNPFYVEHGFIVPFGCMSYSCTKWAVAAALEFIREFSRRMGSPCAFDQFADQLRCNPDSNEERITK